MPRIFEAPPGFVLHPDYLVPELRSQRDALLEALKQIAGYNLPDETAIVEVARAAIKMVEEGK